MDIYLWLVAVCFGGLVLALIGCLVVVQIDTWRDRGRARRAAADVPTHALARSPAPDGDRASHQRPAA